MVWNTCNAKIFARFPQNFGRLHRNFGRIKTTFCEVSFAYFMLTMSCIYTLCWVLGAFGEKFLESYFMQHVMHAIRPSLKLGLQCRVPVAQARLV